MYSVWTKDDLAIIPDILLPLEVIAARLAPGIDQMTATEINKFILDQTWKGKILFRDSWAPVLKEMYRFWERSKG